MPGYGGGKSNHSPTTKIFVGHLPETCRRADLIAEFEKYGKVSECDIVKDYAFVHFENPEEAQQAVAALDGAIFHGSNLRVQFSTSSVRQKPGMGNRDSCFRCGGTGHWSTECPSYNNGGGGGDYRSYGREGGRVGGRGGRGGGGDRMRPYPHMPPRMPNYRELYRNLYREHYISLLDRHQPMPDPSYGRPSAASAAYSDPYNPLGPEAIEAIAERRAMRMANARMEAYDGRPAPGPMRDSLGRPPPDYYAANNRTSMYTSFEGPSLKAPYRGGRGGGPM